MKIHPCRRTATRSLAAIAIAAAAAAAGDCGLTSNASGGLGGAPNIDGPYLYTGQDGTVESLNLVRHGSRLTGTVEALSTVTSNEAEDNAGILDASGKPVLGHPTNSPAYDPNTGSETAVSDNAACGGTPVCFQYLTGSVEGQLGANNRISLRAIFNEEGFATPPLTRVGKLHGNRFVLDGELFRPSNSNAIAGARSSASGLLRTVAMPAYEIHDEIAALQKPPTGYGALQEAVHWDEVLADNLSTLKGDVSINQVRQLGCGYSDAVKRDIQNMQTDVSAETAEINKARKELDSMTPAVARQAGTDVGTVRAEIAAREADVLRNVGQANKAIKQADANEPKVDNILRQFGCGLLDLIFHGILEYCVASG